jgi:hypothetical protein
VPSLADLIIFLTLTRLVIVIIFENFSFALFTPPLGDFQRGIPREIDQRFQKLPLFPIINISPHKRPTFDKRDNKRVLTNQKLYSTIFKISQVVADPFIASQVVADPFIALALFSPHLASSTKTGSILAL